MSVKMQIWISIKHDQISVCDLTFFVFVENNAQFYLHFFFYMIMNMENSVIKISSLYTECCVQNMQNSLKSVFLQNDVKFSILSLTCLYTDEEFHRSSLPWGSLNRTVLWGSRGWQPSVSRRYGVGVPSDLDSVHPHYHQWAGNMPLQRNSCHCLMWMHWKQLNLLEKMHRCLESLDLSLRWCFLFRDSDLGDYSYLS